MCEDSVDPGEKLERGGVGANRRKGVVLMMKLEKSPIIAVTAAAIGAHNEKSEAGKLGGHHIHERILRMCIPMGFKPTAPQLGPQNEQGLSLLSAARATGRVAYTAHQAQPWPEDLPAPGPWC